MTKSVFWLEPKRVKKFSLEQWRKSPGVLMHGASVLEGKEVGKGFYGHFYFFKGEHVPPDCTKEGLEDSLRNTLAFVMGSAFEQMKQKGGNPALVLYLDESIRLKPKQISRLKLALSRGSVLGWRHFTIPADLKEKLMVINLEMPENLMSMNPPERTAWFLKEAENHLKALVNHLHTFVEEGR